MPSSSFFKGAARIVTLGFAALVWSALIITPTLAQDDVTGGKPTLANSKPRQPVPATQSQTGADSHDQIFTIRTNLVTAPVTVIDKSGQFVYDLSQSDFEIFDNGVRQTIQSFDSEMRPMALVIVIETNKNTAALMDQIHPLASMFSSLLVGAKGEAAVIFYNDRVTVGQDFSSNSDKLSKTFADFTARGEGARLDDALWRAVSMLESRPRDERRVIVAFSDGYDSGSETRKTEVVRRATSSEISIYGLGFSLVKEHLSKKPELDRPTAADDNVALPTPPNTIPTPSNSTNQYQTPVPVIPIMIASGEVIKSVLAKSTLEYFSGYTGGVCYSHWSDKTLQDQLSRIASEIQSQYELAYVPNTLGAQGFHRIEVKVRYPGMKVRARAGYFSPGSGTAQK